MSIAMIIVFAVIATDFVFSVVSSIILNFFSRHHSLEFDLMAAINLPAWNLRILNARKTAVSSYDGLVCTIVLTAGLYCFLAASLYSLAV